MKFNFYTFSSVQVLTNSGNLERTSLPKITSVTKPICIESINLHKYDLPFIHTSKINPKIGYPNLG